MNRTLTAMLACGLLAGPSLAREITVSPSAGKEVLNEAIAAASDGDTIHLTKGLYPERIVLTKKIAIVGEAGAVLDPSEPYHPKWKPSPLGKGAYQTSAAKKPQALFIDGKVLAEIDEKRTQTEGIWFWKTLLTKGTDRTGYKQIRGVWMYSAAENIIYIHLADDADPNQQNWSTIWSREPIVTFRAATGASIRGLTLAHGFTGVEFEDKASQCVVEKCVIGPWEKGGINLTEGTSACRVEANEVFRGAFEEWTPGGTKDDYEIWKIHKTAGFYDRVGINLFKAGADNRILRNHIYQTFDGINIGDYTVESLDKPLTSPDDGKGTEIAENIIERTRDSGIELGVGCINVQVHHNILRKTHGGLRFKLPRIGPLFIYRNLLIDGAPFNIWYSMDDSPAEAYVYHNTIVGTASPAVQYSSMPKPHGIGAPKWHYLNNVVVTKSGFFGNRGVDIPVNFTADYNVVVGGGKPWPQDTTKDTHSKYIPTTPLDAEFRPLKDGPAIDAGLDLSTYLNGKPLPGCQPGYYKGKAPDAGAFEAE